MDAAREAAGIDEDPGNGRGIPQDELLDAIHDLFEELGRAPKREEMRNQGAHSTGPYRRAFGTWGDAVIEAGYEPHRPNKYNSEKKTLTCEFCGTKEKEKVSQNNGQENWFCSRPCKHKWQAENIVGKAHHQYDRVSTECDWCGDAKEVKPAVYRNRKITSVT